MATTLEYDLKVNSIGIQYGAEAAEDFASKLKETQIAGDDLEQSLKNQEARIKTLDGAINLLGGSVEVLAGSLTLSGVLTEEQAEKFESAAIGAIALADGAKRVFDGYKSLTEGLQAYGGVAAAARKAQLALNAAISANPYTAAAIAIGVLVAAIVTLIGSQDDEKESLEKAKKVREDYEKQLDAEAAARIRLLKAQGANNEEIQKEIILEAKRAKEKADTDLQRALSENRFSEATQEARKAAIAASDALIEAEAQLGTIQKENREKEAELAKRAAEDRKKEAADKKAKAEEEKKLLEELRIARLEAAQAGAEGLIQVEEDLNLELKKRRQAQLEGDMGLLGQFILDPAMLGKLKQGFIENEGLLREIRLKELDRTTGELLQRNEEYFAKIIFGLDQNSEQYIQAEKQFQANRQLILKVDADERFELEKNNSTNIFNVQFKLAKMLNELAKTEGDKLLAIEEGTYKQRIDDVTAYYDKVIAAARAAGLSVVELERQKADAIKGIERDRREEIEAGLRNTLSAVSGFLSQQREIIDSQLQLELLALGNNESAKEALRQQAFEKQKELRVAEATISGISGAIDAYNSVQGLNKLVPGLGIGVGLALAAAVGAFTVKQIQLIQSSTLGGSSGGSFNNAPSGGGGFSLPTGGGVQVPGSPGNVLPGLPGGGRLGTPAGGGTVQAPIQAYVLASDVSNGQQAAAAISNRRRLAGG